MRTSATAAGSGWMGSGAPHLGVGGGGRSPPRVRRTESALMLTSVRLLQLLSGCRRRTGSSFAGPRPVPGRDPGPGRCGVRAARPGRSVLPRWSVAELVAEDAEGAGGVAEALRGLRRGQALDEVGAQGLVLAVEGLLGGQEEAGFLAVCPLSVSRLIVTTVICYFLPGIATYCGRFYVIAIYSNSVFCAIPSSGRIGMDARFTSRCYMSLFNTGIYSLYRWQVRGYFPVQ